MSDVPFRDREAPLEQGSEVPRATVRPYLTSTRLRQFRALFRRELAAFFLLPMSYLVWAVFLVASGYLFATSLEQGAPASMARTFTAMVLLLLFATPLLTMRLLAEEERQGTLEVLLSSPVSETSIVLAKYFASVVFLAVMLLPTLAYPFVLAWLGQPDPGPLLAGYMGLLLMGALFLAVGIMTSAASRHQVAAAATSFTILFLFWILHQAGESLSPGVTRDLLLYVSAFGQYVAYRDGVVDTRALVYCQSLTSLCLFLAVQLLSARRMR